MTYNLTEPITVIFDAVDNQRELGELTGKHYTPSQIADLSFLVISNYPIFRDNVRIWLRRPPADQTYPDPVTFFQEVHVELCETEALLKELGFQSYNAIVTQIVAQMRTEMGSTNPMIDEELPVDIPLPKELEPHVAIATQGSTTNALIETMVVNMELMRLCLEQVDSPNANRGWQSGGYD